MREVRKEKVICGDLLTGDEPITAGELATVEK